MKTFTVFLAVVMVLLLMIPLIRGTLMHAPEPAQPQQPAANIESGNIVVRGPGNTLAGIAEQINDPDIFRYEPEKATATCKGSITIEGELVIGSRARLPDGQGGSGLTETLEFKTQICGDCMVIVQPGGSLQVYNAEITTVDRSAFRGTCPRGYGIIGRGEVIMHNVRLLYMSGSSSTIFLGEKARGVLDRVVSYGGDTHALSCASVDGSKISIKDCNFAERGNWGCWIGQLSTPLVIQRSTFQGTSGDLLVEGPAQVVLEDCCFRHGRISFPGSRGNVVVCWSRRYKVLDGKTGAPLANVNVRAKSDQKAARQVLVQAVTQSDGTVKLVLPEYEATAGCPVRTDGTNNSSPYTITFTAPTGESARISADPHFVQDGLPTQVSLREK